MGIDDKFIPFPCECTGAVSGDGPEFSYEVCLVGKTVGIGECGKIRFYGVLHIMLDRIQAGKTRVGFRRYSITIFEFTLKLPRADGDLFLQCFQGKQALMFSYDPGCQGCIVKIFPVAAKLVQQEGLGVGDLFFYGR